MDESVSVVIPTYFSEQSIGRALGSVQAQTLKPCEVIIVDDASAADSLASVRRQAAGVDRPDMPVSVHALPRNVGPGSARNAGWERARGKYVAFLDSDDAWHPEKLERQVALMERTGAHFSFHRYAESGDMNADVPGQTWFTFGQFLLKNRCSTPTVMVRRSVDLRFAEGRRHSEDYQLWLRLARRGPAPGLNAELARGFKQAWGEAGLSADLDAMLLGQCRTYVSMVKENALIAFILPLLLTWSMVRYVRRRMLAWRGFVSMGRETS